MGQVQTKNKKKTKSLGRSKVESKEEYFIKNGGILLEKQIALSQGRDIGARQLKIVSLKDINKATNNLHSDFRKIGTLGNNFNTDFYMATMEDRNLIFGVPLQLEPNPRMIDRSLMNVAIITVMNHDNMVKLYGCCLETVVPILLYQLVPNGGLFQYLHSDIASRKRLMWIDLLRVATDIAYALSFMHNALLKPVVHRDFNSSSVLLDCSFRAKLANFGSAVSITPGEKPGKWPVEGTPGYIDPEYIETQEVTDKCDVYSFGVFMLEILTRKQPLVMARGGIDLVHVFVSAVEKNCMMEMIDNEVLEQATDDEIQRVAQLALFCIAKKGTERPTMIDVVGELRRIEGGSRQGVKKRKSEVLSSKVAK